MSQPVLLKVYANLFPVEASLARELSRCCRQALGDASGQEIVSLADRLLLVSFEGIYFPLEEFLSILEFFLKSRQGKAVLTGKLDFLNLEEWTLERFLVENGRIISRMAPLNNVLDYSGH